MTAIGATPMVDVALAYAGRGWPVFPLHTIARGSCTCGRDDPATRNTPAEGCGSPAKHPRTKHGKDDASTDPDVIRSWWRRWPDANVAILTGGASGFVVVDVDPQKGGEESLGLLEVAHGVMPETLRTITGGDGMHIFLVHPGEKVCNSAERKLGPGLDVRGDGGYVVAPPSLHVSGRRYEWLDIDTPPAPMPPWLLDRLREPRPMPPASAGPFPLPVDGGSAYGLHALAAELEDLRGTLQGGRNHQLNAAAFTLFQLVAGGELEEGLVVAELTAAALAIGLGQTEIERTIASGAGKGRLQPRSAPERPAGDRKNYTGGTTRMGAESDDAPPWEPNEGETPHEPGSGGPGPSGGGSGPGDGPLHLTDLGNARRLVAMHGQDLRYVPQWKTWLVWNGVRWRKDSTGEVERRAKDVPRSMMLQGLARGDAGEPLRKWALRSEAANRLEAMVKVAATEPGIPVEPHELDADPWLLNCRNGTLSLQLGTLIDHDRRHMITKLAPVVFDAEARLEMWDQFLLTATDGDEEFIGFLQRAVGYTLTGDTGEEVLFFVHGPSASGKSTFLEAVSKALGDYAMTSAFETFLARRDASNGPTGDLARLVGARMVKAIEADEGRRLAEGLVKSLTGGDTQTVRAMYEKEFEFTPAFKLWLAANAAPKVQHGDEALWRRILRVPFEHVVPKEKRRPEVKKTLQDPRLGGPAILAWAVRGCLQWQRSGLGVPAGVDAATAAYREQMDPLKEFLEEICTLDPETWVDKGELYQAYSEWAKAGGIRSPMTRRSLSDLMLERGFVGERRRFGGQVRRLWVGVRLRDSSDREPALFAGSGVTASQTGPSVTQEAPCDAAVTQGNRTASQPLPLLNGGVDAACDAVTQSPDPFALPAPGERERGSDVTVDTASQSDAWEHFAEVVGRCVSCDGPCASRDPDGQPRHPNCLPGGGF